MFLREHEGLAQVLKATEVQLELAERQWEAAAAEAEAAQKAAEARLEEQWRSMEEHKRRPEQRTAGGAAAYAGAPQEGEHCDGVVSVPWRCCVVATAHCGCAVELCAATNTAPCPTGV